MTEEACTSIKDNLKEIKETLTGRLKILYNEK